MVLFIQNNIIQPFDVKIFQIFYQSKPVKNELHDILLKKSMVYEKNVVNAANEKLQTLFFLIDLLFLKMAITLNVKNAALYVKLKKEVGGGNNLCQKKLFVHSAAEKKQKRNFS